MWMQYRDFGKYKIYPKKMGIDMLSVSGHKIHGPKGIGFIYINEKAKVKPIIFGGEQQKNMRSGTENVPGIAGIGLAAKTIYTDLDEKVAHMRALKQHFIEGVQKIDHTVIHGLYDETSAPHIISVGFAGIRSEDSSSYTGREGNLCIIRFGMCIQPSGDQRSAKGNRSRKKNIWTQRSDSVCQNLLQKKKLTIRWKHYIIVYRCLESTHAIRRKE